MLKTDDQKSSGKMSEKLRVLVVDDSELMRKVIRRELEKAHYEVIESPDGADALRQLMINRGTIDLITLDVEMPKMNGFQTCEEIRKEKYQEVFKPKNRPMLPVLFVTSNDTLENRRKGFEAGATDFISKEFLADEITDVVNRILRPRKTLEGLRALAADDSSTYRSIVAEILDQQGVIVDQVENGKEAFKLFEADPNKYDMIITDYEMPEMDGLTLTRKVRTELGKKDIPIMIVSGSSSKITQLDFFKAGASDYLDKPFLKEELLARLGVHLREILLNRRLKKNLRDLKVAHEELEKSQQETLEISNERKQLLHVLCHDLANPFASIIGFIDLINVNEDSKEMMGNLKVLANNGLEIIDLIRKLRALEENKITLQMIPVRLRNSTLESVMILKQKFLAKEIEPEIKVPSDICVMVEETSFVNSVMNNLLSNAIKFSFPKGKIIISAEPEGDMVKVSIQDFGVGMPERLVNDLFDINKATSRPGTSGESGTGFGMPLVKKFVETYGGSIDIKSKDRKQFPDDHGTEIILRLPVATEE